MSTLPALQINEDELFKVLSNSLYVGAQPESIKMVVSYCNAAKLDPMLKPVHIVPMYCATGQKDSKGYDIKAMRDVVMPGIGLYRIQASRSGEFAGTSEPEFGSDVTETIDGAQITYPAWCKVTVKRLLGTGVIAEFTAKEFWKENYATKGKDSKAPNTMWAKRPYAQIAKCFDDQTEVLTSEGFQAFSSVTGQILQVTKNGLESTNAKPFVQDYSGPMIVADGTRLNFSVTPNHDMLTNCGKIEAQILYDQATKASSKWSIPRTVVSEKPDAVVSDDILKLAGYILADGGHTGYKQFRIAVSRPYKAASLDCLNLHSRKSIKKDADRESESNGRTIRTKDDKQSFAYDFDLVSSFMTDEKRIDPDWAIQLSKRQAKIVVDALIEFDGSHNGSVRRLHQSNTNVIKAFELLSIQAGYSINKGTTQKSDIGDCSLFTLSESQSSPVVKGDENKNSASLTIQQNISGKVWCVTVPSGVIVVRRNGFSMLCGNCAEAQALRKAFPEVGSQPTADEMEGKEIDVTTYSGGQQTKAIDKKEPPTLDDAAFEKKSTAWKAHMAEINETPENLIAHLQTKYILTSEQQETIKSWSANNDQA